jgi:hypothetical protein
MFPSILNSKRNDGIMVITVKNNGELSEQHDEFMKVLRVKLPNGKLESIMYNDSLTTIHYSFTGLNTDKLNSLKTSLNNIITIVKMNIFFSRQGVLL